MKQFILYKALIKTNLEALTVYVDKKVLWGQGHELIIDYNSFRPKQQAWRNWRQKQRRYYVLMVFDLMLCPNIVG